MTRPLRLFVDARLPGDASVELTREQTHYVTNVMRRRAGDPLVLFNGRDGEWRASIRGPAKRALRLEIGLQTRPQADEPGPTLWFAPLKRIRQDLLLEKACELGVARLCPVVMRRSVVETVNLGRQRAILIEAAEQSGRLTVPVLEAPVALDAVVAAAREQTILWADEAAAQPACDSPSGAGLAGTNGPRGRRERDVTSVAGHPPSGGHPLPLSEALREHPEAGLLIGPEGGFDPDERALLQDLAGIVRVSLGPRILRAETAALAALAAWQFARQR